MQPPSDKTLGLIAGAGEFPILVIRGAKRVGLRVVVVGLPGCDAGMLRTQADTFRRAGIARLGRWIRVFRRGGVRRVIMAGRVAKAEALGLPRWRQWLTYLPDWTSIRVWYLRAKDRRNDTLLRAVAEEMRDKGLELVDSTQYCADAMAPEGVLTRVGLSAAQQADADLGWQVAKELGRLDVGQSVAIKDKDIIAVEAIEGTDRMIERAGQLCRGGGWVLVKVAKPRQDMRFDVPTIGPQTVENVAAARGSAIVIEAGNTLLLGREETIAAAERRGIAIVARAESRNVQTSKPAS